MAGLLSDIVGMIDRAKQSAKANVGLLVSDPREYMASLNDQARAFNQASNLATQAKLNEMRGLLVTPEQAAAKEYVDRVNQDLAMGFAGTTSVGKPLISKYPLAPAGQRYEETAHKITQMSPSEFLSSVKKLEIDEASRDNIEYLKEHMMKGGKLDPLIIRANGKEDGRHRAVAAMELGIKKVPVVDYRAK